MRRVACLLPVLLCMLSITACHRGGAPKRAAVPTQALNAGGEPQWSAQVRGEAVSFSDGGDLSLKVAHASREDRGAKGVVWSGPFPAAPGQGAGVLTLTTLKAACQDPATGMTYPLTATVAFAGRRFAGCAAAPGQGLGPRQ